MKFGKLIEDKNISDIINYRKDGLSYTKIKEKTNISLDKIKNICKDNNLNHQSVSQSPNKIEIKEMTEYYKIVKSLKKVSKKYNWSYKTIRKHINPIGKYSNSVEYEVKRKKDIVNNVKNWRKNTKKKLVEYKGGYCKNCNYKKSLRALTFHHIEPKEKDFTISSKSYSFERLKKEVDKCILLCSNCHIEVHEEIENTGESTIINKIIKINN